MIKFGNIEAVSVKAALISVMAGFLLFSCIGCEPGNLFDQLFGKSRSEIREEGLKKVAEITDQDLLAQIAVGHKDHDVRYAAYYKMTDFSKVVQIVQYADILVYLNENPYSIGGTATAPKLFYPGTYRLTFSSFIDVKTYHPLGKTFWEGGVKKQVVSPGYSYGRKEILLTKFSVRFEPGKKYVIIGDKDKGVGIFEVDQWPNDDIALAGALSHKFKVIKMWYK